MPCTASTTYKLVVFGISEVSVNPPSITCPVSEKGVPQKQLESCISSVPPSGYGGQ